MKCVNKISEKDQIILSLDNKKIEDLSEHFQKFIKYVFTDINDTDVISCKKYNGSKIDFIIKVNSIEKNISYKRGNISCIHRDRIYRLLNYFYSINVSKKCIFSILSYHFGDGTFDGSGEEKLYGELLKIKYKEQIKIVNEEFENKELLGKVIDYVLLEESSGKKVDYIYHGDSRYGIYAKASDVKLNMLEEENNYPHDFMRVGVMNFSPLKRCHYYTEEGRIHKNICIFKLNVKRYIKKREK